MHYVYTMYMTDISVQGVLLFQRSTRSHTFAWYRHYHSFQWYSFFKLLCSLEQTLAVIPFSKGTELIIIPITATHSIITPWFQACIYWKMVCYLTTSIAAIHFVLVLSLFHGSTWSNPFCQGHCVYFTTLIAATYYNKRPLVDSKKLKNTVLIWRKQL